VCGKGGHEALACWNRFNPSYTAQGYQQQQQGYQFPNQFAQQKQFPMQQSNSFPVQFPGNMPQSFPLQQQQPPSAAWASVNSASILGPPPQSQPQLWFPDSGATHHVTADPLNLQQSEPAPVSDKLFMGNGQGLVIKSVGSSSFFSPIHPSSSLLLDKLLLVPSITKNLISVSRFARDNHVFFEFHPTTCFVKSQDSNKVLLKGILGNDGLYRFLSFPDLQQQPDKSHIQQNFKTCSVNSLSISEPCNSSSLVRPCNSQNSMCNTTDVASSSICNTWHLRLGHPHFDVLKQVLQYCNISKVNKNTLDFCSACCLGKAHRLPSHLSITQYSFPFELIYTDLWGPAPFFSFDGYSYYISFIDAFTRYTWIYLLKRKSDAISAFKQFHTYVGTQFSTKIKAVQSDWGGEFRSFTQFLNENGIVHRLICPHTHHQNGVAERKHRNIVEKGLCLLAHSSLPLKFWDAAFSTAVYLINRVPSASIGGEIPYTKLYKSDPDFSFLRVFGCACYPFIRPYNKSKFDFHSEECVFLGYSSQHKGYKCLAASGKVYISKDVLFNEVRFPYNSLFSNQADCSSSTSASVSSSIPIASSFNVPTVPSSSPTIPSSTQHHNPTSLPQPTSSNDNEPIPSNTQPLIPNLDTYFIPYQCTYT
jgi:histone deacetylase 1/2